MKHTHTLVQFIRQYVDKPAARALVTAALIAKWRASGANDDAVKVSLSVLPRVMTCT
jgi:hypothetical protein